MGIFENIRSRIKLAAAERQSDQGLRRFEKVLVFLFAYLIAMGMWLLINLGRDYNLDIQLPLEYGTFPENQAPIERLPAYTTATVTGEGWKLLNLYGSAPRVAVNPESESQNLFSAVQSQLAGYSDISISKVEPMTVNIRLEERITRKVAVEARVNMGFRRQFNTVGDIDIRPDSVTISGARSLIEPIENWPTHSVSFDDLHQPINVWVDLETPPELIKISHQQLNLRADIAEYTEGEARVAVEIRAPLRNNQYTITPASIAVRYDIPIHQYAAAQRENLFEAFVQFEDLEADTTGFIEPNVNISNPDFNIKLRSFQPRRLSYYRVIEN